MSDREITYQEAREYLRSHGILPSQINGPLVNLATHAIRQRDAMVWRPIDTAPKDGTEILLLTKSGVISALFVPHEIHHTRDGDEHDGYYWSCYDDTVQIEVDESQATHWMTMPPKPAPTTVQAEAEEVIDG